MTALLLVLGGARSGKSAYAEGRLLDSCGAGVLYVATLLPGDAESDARIEAHGRRRPAGWETVVIRPEDAPAAAVPPLQESDGVLLDGFELALALQDPTTDADAQTLALETAVAMRASARRMACIVSSEVGMGVHPETAAGRAFRDRCGAANQRLAALADEVVLVVAGVPLTLRGVPG